MRERIKKSVLVEVGIVLLIMIGFSLFPSALEQTVEGSSILHSLHLFTGLSAGAICFAIFAQGLMLFGNELSSHRLFSAIVFAGVGIFDVMHSLIYTGTDFIGVRAGSTTDSWLVFFSHVLAAVGMLTIFSSQDKKVLRSRKLFFGAILTSAGVSILMLIFAFQANWELWGGIELWGIPVLYAGALVGVIIRSFREKTSIPWTIVRSLIYMAVGHFMIVTNENYGHESMHSLGQILMAVSYVCVLKEVYHLTIEEPFRNQQQAEERIRLMAYYDDLTKFPNKRMLNECLAGHLLRLDNSNSQHEHIGVAVLNILRFKAINDTLGYAAGDRLLQSVAQELSANCGAMEELYRMGEDEFAMIFWGSSSERDIHSRVEKLLSTVELKLAYDESEYPISLSLGLAIYPTDGESSEILIQNADMAVHNAKELGLDFGRYSSLMKRNAESKLRLEHDLRKGLEREEFYIEYQPQIHLETGEMVGIEALVRWNHPQRGVISPGEFIPIAEESGLIVPLGEWVLRKACEQNKRWQEEGFVPICISVNLSMRQFRQSKLPELVHSILIETGLESKYLELEITESMTFDREAAFDQLIRLKELGIYISIDDFGTGYSSLHYLKNLPIDRLKIDRSFVKEVMIDDNDAAIVSTITSMAHHLKLKVTAEGVENMEQLEFLKLQNCHEGQGYYFSKPVCADQIEKSFLVKLAG